MSTDAARALLLGGALLATPALAAPALEGEFAHAGSPAASIEVLRDDFSIRENTALRPGELPPFELRLLTDGEWLLPAPRGPQATAHPLWDFLAEPGRLEPDPHRPGAWRAALPFALNERNQNCVHYGLLRFAVPGDPGPLDFEWEIAGETCLYFKFDARGAGTLDYRPATITGADALRAAYAAERARRLPVRPLAALAADFPGVDPGPLQPPRPEHATVWGLVTDSVHYRGGCHMRNGPHPFCETLALPSYSTAKGLFAGLAYARMLHRWPELEHATVLEWLPECAAGDGAWAGVSLRHLADMATGQYRSAVYDEDEADPAMEAFFLADTAAAKLEFACSAWPRREAPGQRPVYHSTDHFLLGVALTRFLRQQLGPDADLHRDLLRADLLGPVQPGPALDWTLRTADEAAQPFVSHGLFYHPDDVARLGRWLLDDAALRGRLAPDAVAAIRFRDPARMLRWETARGEAYALGFWGVDVAPELGCAEPAWIPFLSGYGGIIWALLPNGLVYYFFGDGGHGPWLDAVIESDKIAPVCEKSTVKTKS